jgi:hypothetical protein
MKQVHTKQAGNPNPMKKHWPKQKNLLILPVCLMLYKA